MILIKKIVRGYFWLFSEMTDSRVDHFFLMSSPLQPIFIGISYLFLIYKILPEFMKNRQPFKLDKILILFNLSQVLINAYIFYYAFFEVQKLNWACSSIDFSDTPHTRFVLKLFFTYFLTKIADLLDTIFFILRGKTNQVSFLHVYHHFGMIALGWVGVRFMGGGHSIFLGLANTFVHSIMYFYYLLTIWKPEYKGSIWWKKHITHLQLVQFIFFVFIYGQLLFKPDCDYPKIASYAIVPQSIFMMTLFGDFYYKAYIKPQKKLRQK